MRLTFRSLRDDTGSNTVEFALLFPLIFSLIGMAIFVMLGVAHGALLDRAAEIVAREVSIDGDLDRALSQAQDSTTMITLVDAAVTGEDGAPLAGRPSAGEVFTVAVSSNSTNPTAGMISLVMGGQSMGTTLTLTRTARGLGQ